MSETREEARIELKHMDDRHAEWMREILTDAGVKESAITRGES